MGKLIRSRLGSRVVLARVQQKPIRVAKIPSGAPLHESVIVHPRYVDPTIDHEIIDVVGRLEGRTISVVGVLNGSCVVGIDEPFVVDGHEVPILNFKGVGATVKQVDMLMHLQVYLDGTPRIRGRDVFGRLWGALVKKRAEEEFYSNIFRELGIPETPYLRINGVPKEVVLNVQRVGRAISAKHGIGDLEENELPELCQVVRGFNTNIRMGETMMIDHSYDLIERLAVMDARIVKEICRIYKEGGAISFTPNVWENRFIDGTYTDRSNYFLGDSGEIIWYRTEGELLVRVILESAKPYLGSDLDTYLQIVFINLGFRDLAMKTDFMDEWERCKAIDTLFSSLTS